MSLCIRLKLNLLSITKREHEKFRQVKLVKKHAECDHKNP